MDDSIRPCAIGVEAVVADPAQRMVHALVQLLQQRLRVTGAAQLQQLLVSPHDSFR